MTLTLGFATIILFAYLARFFPNKGELKSTKSFDQLQSEYKNWEFKFLIIMLTGTVLLTFFLNPILVYLAANSKPPKEAIFYVIPESGIWYAPAAILGFVITIYLMETLGRLILKTRMSEYHFYTNLKYGFDGKKITKPLMWVLLVISAAVTWGYGTNFISIEENRIVYHQLRTLSEKTYSYSEVDQIYFVQNKKIDDELIYEPYYYLKFSDGAFWNTLTGLSKNEENEEIFKYISFKANVELKTIPYLNK